MFVGRLGPLCSFAVSVVSYHLKTKSRNSLFSYLKMPQKSILSFFSSKLDEKSTQSSPSPEKTKKRKRIVLESDDSHSPQKTSISNKVDKSDDSKTRDSLKEIGNKNSPVKVTSGDDSAKKVSVTEASSPESAKNPSPKKEHEVPQPKRRKTLQKSPALNSKTPPKKSESPKAGRRNPIKKDSNPASSVSKPSDPKSGHRSIDEFDPSKDSFDPIKDACWGLDEPVPYIAFAKTLESIESTSSRLKIIEVLANFYRSVGVLSPKELCVCLNMSINRLGPSYEGLELGIGESLLVKALSLTTGASNDRIKSELNRLGDLGAVAEAVRSRQQTMFKPKPLTLKVVAERLKEIALMVGNASQTKKVKLIQSLLVACRECEAKYLIRSLQGKLRIGLAEQSVLAALGQAAALTPLHSVRALLAEGQLPPPTLLDASRGAGSEAAWKARCEAVVGRVKQAYAQCPDYARIVAALLEEGPDSLHRRCCITPGVPLRPMLAHPTHGVREVLKRFDQADFTCEYKYDGERAQIHLLPDGSVRVYSRNQEDNTSKYPDIVNSLVASVLERARLTETASGLLRRIEAELAGEEGATTAEDDRDGENTAVSGEGEDATGTPVISFIIDSEAVAWDVDTAQILPFQVLSTRKRKDVQEGDVKVRVCIYAFDLLFLNGVPLTEQSLRRRRQLLREVFPTLPGKFMFATSLDTSDTEEIARFMDESVKGNCEGLMVKTLDKGATYEIAKRSRNWLKLKKDYLEGIGDTLDLVVIGGFHGTGKRTGRYGGFLLACYNPDDEEYQTICKVGTGLKDEDLATLSDFLKDHIIPSAKTYYQYTKNLVPDHWFEPVQVWEVKAADISISPAHKAAAGMADPEKGLSLRFPRFLRVREDKKPEDATTSAQVYDMYCNQEQVKNAEANREEEDFY